MLFVFGAHYYIWLYKSPAADIEIFVVGKQWMWKVQHPGGQREIDEVHVPVGKIVRLVIASQDVVHSFFVPAFRIKRDAVPGTYNSVWFKATAPGTYRLECSEFCGTEHVKMAGAIVAMEPAAYTDWLAERGTGETLAQQGAKAVSRTRLQRLSLSDEHRARAEPRRALRQARASDGRHDGGGRPAVHHGLRSCFQRSRSSPGIRRSCPPLPGRSAKRI